MGITPSQRGNIAAGGVRAGQRAKKAPVPRAPSPREMPLIYLFCLLNEKIQPKNPHTPLPGGAAGKNLAIVPSSQSLHPSVAGRKSRGIFLQKRGARANQPKLGKSHLYPGELRGAR